MVTVDRVPVLWDVTARPAKIVVPRSTVAVEPAMGVHETPSGEVKAVNVLPERVTSR
jgi:hypothetical protein